MLKFKAYGYELFGEMKRVRISEPLRYPRRINGRQVDLSFGVHAPISHLSNAKAKKGLKSKIGNSDEKSTRYSRKTILAFAPRLSTYIATDRNAPNSTYPFQ